MAVRWEQTTPSVAAMLRAGIEDCLAVLSFPEHHRRKFRSTNLLENMMKRLKKRTKVIGVFPNRRQAASTCARASSLLSE